MSTKKDPNVIDLGYTSKYDMPMMASDSSKKGKKEKPPTQYPSLVIIDKPEVVKQVELGKTYAATIQVKVTGVEQNDNAQKTYKDKHRVEFDVLSIELETPEEEANEGESEGDDEKPDFSSLGKKD